MILMIIQVYVSAKIYNQSISYEQEITRIHEKNQKR
jgi:hypothetical protein